MRKKTKVKQYVKLRDWGKDRPFPWYVPAAGYEELPLEQVMYCMHCEREFAWGDALVDKEDGFVECAYAPDCDGSAPMDIHTAK